MGIYRIKAKANAKTNTVANAIAKAKANAKANARAKAKAIPKAKAHVRCVQPLSIAHAAGSSVDSTCTGCVCTLSGRSREGGSPPARGGYPSLKHEKKSFFKKKILFANKYLFSAQDFRGIPSTSSRGSQDFRGIPSTSSRGSQDSRGIHSPNKKYIF